MEMNKDIEHLSFDHSLTLLFTYVCMYTFSSANKECLKSVWRLDREMPGPHRKEKLKSEKAYLPETFSIRNESEGALDIHSFVFPLDKYITARQPHSRF